MTCIVVGTKVFDCNTPDDPLNQRVYHFLELTHAVSRAGSEWGRSPSDNLGLFQSDYLFEAVIDTISFIDIASAVRDLPASVSDSLAFLGFTSVSGGRTSGDAPVEAIFDSNTSAGMVVYVSSSGHVDLAQADAVSTATPIGLALTDVLATEIGQYKPEGQVSLSDWTAIIGSTFLTAGAIYFLSETTAGGMSTTPPNTGGETIVRIGRAITTTTIDIEIAQPVLL